MKLGIVEYVNQFLDASESKLQPFIISGLLNREYLRGNQFKKVNKDRLIIQNKKEDRSVYTERKAFNRMLPIFLTRYGILSSNRPIPGFKAASSFSSSINGVVEGNQYLEEFSKECNFKSKYNEIIKLSENDGIVWVKTGIDWTKGDVISVNKMKIKTDGETEEITVNIREGRPFIDIVPIHEVFVKSMNISNPDKISELVYRRPFSCDYIEARFGYRPPAEDIIGEISASPYYFDLGFSAIDKSNEYAFVKEYYKKPDAVYPFGRFVLIAGDKVLYDGDLPYENAAGERRVIPFIPITLASIPGHLIGPTVYNQIIPMQDTYNSVKNRLLEYVNHLAIGQLYYWEGSLINKNAFSNKPGKLIGLKRNSRPPQPIQKERIGAEIISYLRTVEEDMLITSGLSQLQAYGMSKSNMRTDGVVDKITDSDSNKLSNAVDNLSEGIINLFKQIIYLEKQRQKLLLEEYEVANADNYMLKYKLREVDPEELVIVNREFLVSSDIVLEKKVMQAANLGIYNPQAGLSYRSKVEMLDAINSGYLKDTLDPTQRANYELIQAEQEEIQNLLSPMVEEFHDHDQHIVEHNLFRLSPLMRKLRDTDKERYDNIREALDLHIANHQQYIGDSQNNNDLNNAKAFI